MRQFGERRRSLHQGIGGLFADAHFTTVPKEHHAADERYNLIDVQHDIREFQTSSHFCIPPLFTIHYSLESRRPSDIGPGAAFGPSRNHPAESVCAARRRMPEGGPMPDEDTVRRMRKPCREAVYGEHAPVTHSEQLPSLSHRIVVVPSVTLTALPSVETLAFAASPPLPVK